MEFEGDQNIKITEMQYLFSDYCISSIFSHIKNIYLGESARIYLSSQEISKIRVIRETPHYRLKQIHDIIAAVFRYKYSNGEFRKELFEESNDIIKLYFESHYIDTLWLKHISIDYWYLNKKWLEFFLETIEKWHELLYELGNIMFRSCINEVEDYELINLSINNAVRIIKDRYYYIPWIAK